MAHICVILFLYIIASSLDDSEDILQRRNCFIDQVNTIVCFFDKLNWTNSVCIVYCSSIALIN